jgi:hypothetical protein
MRSSIVLAVVVLVVGAAAPSAASAAATWNSGALSESTITDCVSIINGTPMSSPGAGVTASVYEDYAAPPAAGTPYYLAVDVFGIGDACSGQAADIHMTLPANTSLSVGLATPLQCFPLLSNGNTVSTGLADSSGACPQNPQPDGSGGFTFDMAANAGFDATSFFPAWAIPIGAGVELHIPVVTTVATPQGTATANVHMLDGNSDPTLSSSVPVIVGGTGTSPTAGTAYAVNGAQATVTNTSVTFTADFVYDYSLNVGAPEFSWGNSSSTPNSLVFNLDFAQVPYDVQPSMTLTGLQAGCTYHWKATLLDNTAHVLAGGTDMTFTTTGSGGNCSIPAPISAPGPGPSHTDRRQPLIPAVVLRNGFTPPPPEPPVNPAPPATTTSTTPAPPTTPTTPTVTDRITKLTLASRSVRSGKPVTFDVTLAAAGKVTIIIVRHVPASGHGKHRRKAHDVTIGTKTFTGKVGRDALKLTTLHGHKLPRGSYTAKLTAGGKTHSISFTIR